MLVLQWPTRDDDDLDDLVAMEDLLLDGLPDDVEVDGHDIGSGEMNVFVLCDDPEATFERARALLEDTGRFGDLRAGHRHVDGEDYAVLWPEGLARFDVR